MPLVVVEMVGEDVVTAEVTQALADAMGRALQSGPGGTWVRVRAIQPAHYAENDVPHDSVRPVFVTVLERVRPSANELRAQIASVTAAVASVTGREAAHVHVVFEEAGTGRLAFGGRLVEVTRDRR